jgi:hypothetical protein
MLVLGACGDGRGTSPQPPATPELFASTSFADCGKGGGQSPSPISVDSSRLAGLLHGVWVGNRIVPSGRSLLPRLRAGQEPPAHYVAIYDMAAGKAILFEESGPHIRENAFGRMFPPASKGSLRMVFLHCGAQFREEFVKVSADPATGLQALAQVTGTQLAGKPVSEAWAALQRAGVFARKPAPALTVGALFDVSTRTLQGQTPGVYGQELEMATTKASSAPEFTTDGTVPIEGGFIEGVSTASGNYLVAAEYSSTKPEPTPVHTQGGGASLSRASGAEQNRSDFYRLVIGPLH